MTSGKSNSYPLKCSGWMAFAIYLALSLLFFGRGLIGHLSDRYVGTGTDPGAFIFFLEWWKYAFTHRVNPFFTYLQWAPSGANLAWSTCIPLFGIAAIPLTSTLGPIVTFNLIALLCPALAAWAAFLLCRYLSSSSWAALAGGYVFGFSPWMLSRLLGHLALLMMFPAPLMVLATLRFLNEEISATAFGTSLSTLIVAQFLCWPEAVATESLFASIAIAVACAIAPQWRKSIRRLILPTSCAYVAAAIILSPYLYYFFAFGQPALSDWFTSVMSVAPSNFLVPMTTTLFGTIDRIRELSNGNTIYETGSYIAPPLLLIVLSFTWSRWKDWRTRLLINLLVIVCVASMGSHMTIQGHRPIPLPWIIAGHLPLIDKAIPARLSVYSFLIMAIILSLWLSDNAIRKSLRAAGVGAVILLTLPNPSASFWATDVNTPDFFSTGLYRQYIAPGDNVLILPYGGESKSNIWQATSEMYFRMAGGYVGQPLIPDAYLRYYPIVYAFFNLMDIPLSSELLKVFLVRQQVNAVVVADQGYPLWILSRDNKVQTISATALTPDETASIRSLFATLGVKAVQVGGVSLYRIPLDQLSSYKDVDEHRLEQQIIAIQLDTLIEAAENYLFRGYSLSELNPVEVQRLGLVPARWVSGMSIYSLRAPIQNGLVVTSLADGNVLVGVVGTRDDLQNLANEYRIYAKTIEVSPLLQSTAWAESSRWILLLECDREQLARAAEFARQNLSAIKNPPASSAPTLDAPASNPSASP